MKLILVGILLIKVFTEATLCPDRAQRCPIWGTCCANEDGTYGCCPYKDADCCADFIHCCPTGTHCNVTTRTCENGPKTLLMSTSFSWMVPHYDHEVVAAVFDSHVDANEVEKKIGVKGDNVCPDGQLCDGDSTCCQTQNGTFGCCPYSKADCCSDRIHCCPDGFNCDIENRRCVKKQEFDYFNILEPVEVPLFNIEKTKYEERRVNVCHSFNPCNIGGMTCCPSENSRYCCPQGTVCSSNGKGCVKEKKLKMFFEDSFVPLKNEAPKNVSVGMVCPDQTESCPAQSTCCLMANRRYGCCPFPSATCCADKIHCCPHGYICNNDNCEKKPYLHLFDQPSFLLRVPLE